MQLSFEVKDEYVKAYIEALEKLNNADPSDKNTLKLVAKTFKNAGATVLSAIEECLEEVIEVQGYEQKWMRVSKVLIILPPRIVIYGRN